MSLEVIFFPRIGRLELVKICFCTPLSLNSWLNHQLILSFLFLLLNLTGCYSCLSSQMTIDVRGNTFCEFIFRLTDLKQALALIGNTRERKTSPLGILGMVKFTSFTSLEDI